MTLENFGVFLGFFFGMEAVAWTAHKYLMHGPLWMLHADHHLKGEDGFFERNDSSSSSSPRRASRCCTRA